MPNNEIMLSIITATYNSEKYIEQTLNSVLSQHYRYYEYIIVDGKSSDSTLDIINRYIPLFEGRLRYISEPDDGLYYAMNKGINLATGDYIGIINSDDYYHEEAFQHVIDAIRSSELPLDVIYGDHNVVDEENNIIHTSNSTHKNLKRKMSVSHPTCFVRRETYMRFGSFDTSYRITADYELMLRFQSKGCKFYKIHRVMASYRVGGASSNNFKCVMEPYCIQKQYIGIPWAVRNLCIETGKFIINAAGRKSLFVRKIINVYKVNKAVKR